MQVRNATKGYLIRDKIYNTYVSYADNHLSSDCWSIIRNSANVYDTLAQARKIASYMAKICKIKRNDIVIEPLKIYDIVNNDYQCGNVEISNKYYLFVEKIDCENGNEDILVELFDKNTNDCLCNCLAYVGHTFTSDTDTTDLIEYAHKVIKLYEKDN